MILYCGYFRGIRTLRWNIARMAAPKLAHKTSLSARRRTTPVPFLLARAVERFRGYVEGHPIAGLGILSLHKNRMVRVVGDEPPEID